MARIDDIVRFAADKGFIYGPEPEIYGGLAGFYTYGPLGKLLKNNVEEAIRRVFMGHDFFEVECPTVMPKAVWEASGHLGGFTDPVVRSKKLDKPFRVDHLIEEAFPDQQCGGWSIEDYNKFLSDNEVVFPGTDERVPAAVEAHTLMMKTTVGLDHECYNRPETATTTYLPFGRYMRFFRDKLPNGVFQIGKAYRNEISPRQFVVRMREFTQAEGQLIIFEDQKKEFAKFDACAAAILPVWTEEAQKAGKDVDPITVKEAVEKGLFGSQAYGYVLHLAHNLFTEMGIPLERMRLRQHHSDEKAFYALDAWDLEIKTESFGWIECCGIHDRGNYDLSQHEKFSGKELKARDETHDKQTPHIIEIAFGVDRPVFALLDCFYSMKEEDVGRDLFAVPYHLAPIKVALFPLVNKLNEKGLEVLKDLREHMYVFYDKSGSIGKRYARADEVGTPYCITVDFETLEGQGVTVRDRDTLQQKRVQLEDLPGELKKLLNERVPFTEIQGQDL